MDAFWTRLTEGLSWGDALTFSLTFFTLKILTLGAGDILFEAAHRKGWWRPYEVVPDKGPRESLRREAIASILKDNALFLFILLPFVLYPLFVHAGVRFEGPGDPLWVVALQIVAFFIINDTIFYWSHRLLHSPRLFAAVHFKHHRYRYVRPLSVEFSHSLENLLNLVAFIAGPLLLGPHILTVYIWVVVRMWETVDAHSGYAFPFSPSGERHAFHHLAVHCNYGSLWSPWDRLLGTDSAYRAWVKGGRVGEPRPIKR